MKSITIFYHDDFDGLASAGILANFFDWLYKTKCDVRFVSVNYETREDYFQALSSCNGETAVVDFLYHPKATWWFDHHNTTFGEFDPTTYSNTPQKYCDFTAKSCPSLLFDFFKINYPAFYASRNDVYQILIDYADKIDSALYESVEEIFSYDDPFIAFNAIMGAKKQTFLKQKFIHSVRELSYLHFFKRSEFVYNKKHLVGIFGQYLKCIDSIIEDNSGILTINYLDSNIPMDRYIGYLFYPEAKSVISLSLRSEKFYIGVGINPWKENPGINIGKLMAKFGGGGRASVGAVLLNSFDEMKKVYNYIKTELIKLV